MKHLLSTKLGIVLLCGICAETVEAMPSNSRSGRKGDAKARLQAKVVEKQYPDNPEAAQQALKETQQSGYDNQIARLQQQHSVMQATQGSSSQRNKKNHLRARVEGLKHPLFLNALYQ